MTDGHTPPHGPGPDPMPEGEEQAPPGTRTMAIVRWALVALMALAAVAAWVDHVRSSRGTGQEAGAQYICPMHPQIVTTYKGECPICGMDLVPSGGAKSAAAEARYTCPMHPAFVTGDAGARCPDCGMKLVPLATTSPAAPGGPPIPGVAPVEISADRVQLIGMKSVPAVRQTLASTIRAVGFVAANESSLVSVNTRFSGWVEQLSVGQTGQLVQKGEVLAAIYSPEMLNAQQVFLNAIKWTVRKPGGSAQAPGIANDLERDARLRLELLGVANQDIDAIAEAGETQRTINVRSPVRGYVARKSVLKGLYVQAGTELFQLADLSTVWVLVDVYESDIPRVRVGQRASFELKAYPGKKFAGKVQFIYPALNTGSRTLQARVELRNPGLELRPGMFGDMTLDLGDAEALVVPLEALVDTGDHQYVFVDRGGGRYEPRPVKAGWSDEGRVAILAGLAEGERVVTTANFLLDSESRLRAAVEGFNAAPASAPPAHGDQPGSTPGAEAHGGPPGAALHQHAAGPRFTCPMHPAFVTTDPKARCPDCGMKLVPVPAGPPARDGGKAAPGHPAPMPMKPAAAAAPTPKVPEATGAAMPKMSPHVVPPVLAPMPRLTPPAPSSAPEAGAAPLYTCPMHPAFVTTDAEARCPDCGMKLVPKPPGTAPPVPMPSMPHAHAAGAAEAGAHAAGPSGAAAPGGDGAMAMPPAAAPAAGDPMAMPPPKDHGGAMSMPNPPPPAPGDPSPSPTAPPPAAPKP